MEHRTSRWVIAGAAILLIALGAGCGFSASLFANPTPTPVVDVVTVPAATPTPASASTSTSASTSAVAAQPAPTSTPGPTLVAPMQDEAAAANALEAQIIAVHDAVAQSVVNITNRSVAYDMFMQPVPQEGTGSGFVYDDQGNIITNFHVVEGADQLLVTLANGQNYEAELVGEDAINDLAVIHIDAGADLPQPVPLADSDKVRVGQFVVAIGNPFGLEQTLTVGVISALGRIIQSPEDNRFIGEAIQTDAAINPGNSGGPLLDLQGRVIGVNSQIISPSQANAGIGFAVSSNTVRRVVPELIARGYYPHAWLGITSLPLSANAADAFRQAGMAVPVDQGLLIIEVDAGGPAEQAGLRGGDRVVRFGRYNIPLGGDIVVSIDGKPIQTSRDLNLYLDTQTQVGQTVQVTVIRDGQEQAFNVTLTERPMQ
jgi:S1-C subfamily serine protease